MDYFDFDSYGLARAMKPKFCERFGPPRQPGEELTEHHQDLAFALQATIEADDLARGAWPDTGFSLAQPVPRRRRGAQLCGQLPGARRNGRPTSLDSAQRV